MKLHEFMTTPALSGAEFLGPSWAMWRIIARLYDGDAALLTPDEQAIAQIALVRWGANGLAVSTGTDLIAISGGFVGP